MLTVLGMADLTHREARVLTCIAYHDGPGGAFPSLDTLAEECGMLRGRVAETIAALGRKGRLVRTPGRGRGKGRGRETSRYAVIYSVPETRDFVTGLQRPGNRGFTASRKPGTGTGREQEERGGESDGGPPDPPPCTAAKPLEFGEPEGKRAAAKKGECLECPEGRACGWLGVEGDRCPHCGAD